MKLQDPLRKDEVPPELLAEAGVWVARLHGPNRTPAMEHGFREWLATSPVHARGFELASEVWEDSQNLARVISYEPSVSRWSALRPAASLAAIAIAVVVGAVLFFHDPGVSTVIGEQRQLTLEDGTRVFLNTETRVVVRYDDRERRVRLEEGEALFDVARRPTWPFVVMAGDHQIRALGTSFVVRRDEQQVAVTLVEGRISVAPVHPDKLAPAVPPPAAQILSPGERLTIADGGPPVLDRPVLDAVIAWRRGQVVLDDTPLAAAIDEMNRYSAVKLVVERPEAANLLVNGLFQAGDSESFAAAVAQIYGLEVVRERQQILLAGVPAGQARSPGAPIN